MAVRPEVLAQLARMLGDDSLRAAGDEQVQAAVEERFDALVRAIVAETAGSEDVFDRTSALSYLESRLAFLSAVLRSEQVARIRESAAKSMQSW